MFSGEGVNGSGIGHKRLMTQASNLEVSIIQARVDRLWIYTHTYIYIERERDFNTTDMASATINVLYAFSAFSMLQFWLFSTKHSCCKCA